MSRIVSYLNDESGAAAAEYALILALICAAIATALVALQGKVSGAINAAAAAIPS